MAIPNRVELRAETLACLEQGITQSDLMRIEIAKRFGLDSLHPTFINNHAWSLVDLQTQAAIRKVEVGVYALADTSKFDDRLVSNSAQPKRPSKSVAIPNRVELRTETLACLEQGITRSDLMREDIAKRYGIDPLHPTFVNNHAWSLVYLQTQGAIRKVANGVYALADMPKRADTLASNSAQPKRHSKSEGNQIIPLSIDKIPAWTRNLIGAANTRNAKKFYSAIRLTNEDLLTLWDRCSGVCALSGLPFSGERIGTGKAQRPFYPSLDRIDPEQPYSVENCRLVLQAVNFALNSYGDEVFLKIARATARAHSNE